MADVNHGYGGGRDSSQTCIRGQCITTGGVILAVVLNEFTVVMNSVIVTEIRATRDDTTTIDCAVGFHRNAIERAGNAIRQSNRANRGKGFINEFTGDLWRVTITVNKLTSDTTLTHDDERSTGGWQVDDSGCDEQEYRINVEVTDAGGYSRTARQMQIVDGGAAGWPQ